MKTLSGAGGAPTDGGTWFPGLGDSLSCLAGDTTDAVLAFPSTVAKERESWFVLDLAVMVKWAGAVDPWDRSQGLGETGQHMGALHPCAKPAGCF